MTDLTADQKAILLAVFLNPGVVPAKIHEWLEVRKHVFKRYIPFDEYGPVLDGLDDLERVGLIDNYLDSNTGLYVWQITNEGRQYL